VVLIEHQLSGEDGLAFTRAAARRGLTTPLILLSAAGPAGLDIAAIEAGAADFLDKEELDVERLERAIRLALARQRRSARLEAPPLHDPLTGLASRNAYLDRLEQALARARRRRQLAAVMLVDLDRFAAINQRLGHVAGDSILRLLGGRLRRHLRGTDTTARLAADRFALILEDLSRPEHAGTVSPRSPARSPSATRP
jgi:PleD family two-component response regulator